MGKALVIVESPAKARTITRFLGDDYTVLASMGHIRDLPEKKFGVDLENNFTPDYEVTKDPRRKKTIDELKKVAKGADTVYLAPDPDREGEAIAWHLQEILKPVTKADFKRVTFHEITRTAIDKAFDDAHDIDQDRVDAQQARRVLDRIVGWQVSDFLRRRVFGATSAGRVQTVALRLICERESAINAFEPQEYWSLKARLENDEKTKFIVSLARLDNKKVEIPNAEAANALKAELDDNATFTVKNIISKQKKQKAAPPFITSTLQQAASSSLRLNPTQSMRVAQQLYEGVDLGIEGTTGLITYMRTDSVSIAKEAQDATLDFISNEYGSEYLPAKPNFYKSKNSAQGAHEAIRPTDVNRTPEKMKKYLDKNQLALYTLIWKRLVASQMTQAIFKQETVELDATGPSCTHEFLFRITATRNIFPGYLKVYNFKDEGDEEEELEKTLPALSKGEVCQKDEFLLKQHFTEPPPRFSEATLVKELEANGIGRPSTYSAIVRTIQSREYVGKEKGRLVPSKIGMESCNYLTSSIPSLFEIKFTAGMEDTLDKVEHGDVSWTDMLGKFYNGFSDWMSTAKTAGAPPESHYSAVLDLFPEDFVYAEPQKVGRRTYSDEKFVTSLRKNIADEKELTAKQWVNLLKVAVKYPDLRSSLDALAKKLNFTEDVEAEYQIQREKAAAAENPDTESLRLIALLDKVTFVEPRKVGKRTYDDSLFVTSLRDQATAGKKLSVNQVGALHKLLAKYQTQIENYNDVAKELGLPTLEENAAKNKEITELLALFEEITEWNEPTKKGRFTYDDKEFASSLTTQFAEKGALSDRQLAAAKKTLLKYKTQIHEFDGKAMRLGIKPETEETGVNCPDCGKPILKRKARGRVFFGCSAYPKCKYITNDLESIKS